jgi:hypothetical protein
MNKFQGPRLAGRDVAVRGAPHTLKTGTDLWRPADLGF